MNTIETLNKVDHLLANLDSFDDEIQKEINSLRNETKALIHILEVGGHVVAAEFGIKGLLPRIDDLVNRLTERETAPNSEIRPYNR